MRANGIINLFDVSTSQDETTGERAKQIVGLKRVNGSVRSVGMNTFWQAVAARVRLETQILIRSRMYANQKYIYTNGNLYEVYNSAPADDEINVRLNCTRCNDHELKGAIEDALGLLEDS